MNKEIVKYTDWLSYYFYQPFAYFILRLIKNTKITPNKVTLLSLVVGIFSALLLIFDNKISSLIFLNLSFVLDCLDGQLARYKKLFSSFGMFLDNVSDRIVESLFIFSIAYQYNAFEKILIIFIIYSLYIYMSDMIIYANYSYSRLSIKEKILFLPIYFLNRSFVILILSISVFYFYFIYILGILGLYGIIFRFYRELYGRL